MMENKIKIFPIPENAWWRRKEKELTLVPVGNWEINAPKNRWTLSELGWSWWGLVDKPEIHFFINQPSKILAFETGEEDSLLEELLNIFTPENNLIFIPETPEDIWELREIADRPVFSNRSQKLMEPRIKLIDEWAGMDVRKDTPSFLSTVKIHPEKSYTFTYLPTGFQVPFDVWYDTEYSLEIYLGTEKKRNPKSTYHEIQKEGSLLEALTIPERKTWIENIKQLSKK